MKKNDTLVTAFSFGFAMIIGMMLAVYLGMKIDEWLNTSPLFILIFVVYVMVGSFVRLYKKVTGDSNEK